MDPQESKTNATTVLEHLDWVRGLARSLVRDASVADDITQEAWLAALRRPAAAGVASRGWLARVVRNAVRQENRRAAIRSEHEERARLRDETASTDELVDRVHTQRLVVDAVLALDTPYQRVILLRYFEGLAPREIARRQEIPVATVKTRLRRGLGQLREALDKRHAGERDTWMSAVTALAVPTGSGVGIGTLVTGGIAMGTMTKVSAGFLVAAACVYFATRTPPAASPRITAVEPQAAEVELEGAAAAPMAADPATEAGRRSPVAEESSARVSSARGSNVLRVVLEGLTEEDARMATVTLTGVDKPNEWPVEIRDSWLCQGLVSEFDLDPFFASVERYEDLRVDELEVEVDHPHHLSERTRVPLSLGVELTTGKTVHEVRVRLARPEFWPEYTLAVRDAHTRAHLEDIELHFARGNSNAVWGQNRMSTLLGGGLRSPIALTVGREADEPEATVAGLALSPAAGEPPRLVELSRRFPHKRGVTVSVRAPGYVWGSIALDVSKGAEHELLLGPAAALDVRLTNVQLERYSALKTEAMLCVYWIRADGGDQYVRFERLDETLMTDGLRLEHLEPGGYRVSVELVGGSWAKRPVLAREELSLAAGETRELVQALANPPAPPAHATLGGVISFPAFGGEEKVRLQLYSQTNEMSRRPDVELFLADMQRVGGALSTWSFRLEDLPVGLYRVQLLPFLKGLMIELPADGREDLQLVLSEIAEVLVETVDGQTGERVPLDGFYYRKQETLPGQVHNDGARADTEEPGRFRFWTAPGAVRVWPGIPGELDYGRNWEDLELVPGLQSVRFELGPVCAIRFEFRDGEATLPQLDGIWNEMSRGIRGVDHEGRLYSIKDVTKGKLVKVDAPGVYEVSFEGVGADRFHPIPPRRIDVHPGETAEVIVELRRK